MPTDDTRRTSHDGEDLGLNSDPELILDVGGELLDRAREVSQNVQDRVRRALEAASDPPDSPQA